MKDLSIVLGENIQLYRKRAGLTQVELARRIGVTYQAVSKWETGKSVPDVFLLPTLARIFRCSIDELFAEAG